MAVAGLKLLFLGGFDVSVNGQSLAAHCYSKMRALLAYLAVERVQDHRREALAELLWSSNDPVTARGNLRRTLSDLRRTVELPSGTALFVVNKTTIRFVPGGYLDVSDFQDSPADDETRLLALYQGEFLAGLTLADCPGFNDWVQLQREALARRALGLLEKLSERHAQAGDYARALELALRISALEPWEEDACRWSMRLFALQGRSAAALAHYQSFCAALRRDLDLQPAAATQLLAQSIRDGELTRLRPEFGLQGSQVAAPAARLPADNLGARNRRIGDRRQGPRRSEWPLESLRVSVLYCEISCDVALEHADEQVQRLTAIKSRCELILRQHSGHVVPVHGVNLLGYFGYPQASGDAALHAVQAALALTTEAAAGVVICVGVHCGLVIAGADPTRPDSVGKTSSQAIQLRNWAAPGEVVISQPTHAMVEDRFECASLGLHGVPSLSGPQELFRVLRATADIAGTPGCDSN